MDLDLTTDQKLFRSASKSFLDKEMSLPAVRGLAESGGGFPRPWWRQGAELGWTSMLVPEESGGGSVSGDGLADLAIVAEEMGRLVSPGPLLSTSAVLAGLVAAGGDQAATLDGLVSGELVGTWAVYEPRRGWAPLEPGTTATPTATGYRLDGVKDRVEAADQADVLLVTAGTPDGPTQFLVRTGTAGVTVTPSWSLDFTRHFAEVRFDGVEVDAGAVVGTPGGAAAAVERQLQVAVALQCAETSGAIDRVLEFTIGWAFDRYTFGRPLASYQALKHRFADSTTWVQACHATTQAAVRAVGSGSPDAAELVSVAKSYVGAKAPQIVQDCVQLHGGIGVTWEHDLHLYLRRVTVNRALFGTPEEHRRRITDLIDLPGRGEQQP
jgi:alkylation response protein AidB-like acyl-CoA dehydrogenase